MERRRPGQRRELGPYRRHELLTGEIIYPALGYSGYGDGVGTDLSAFISEEMRRDWIENRTALLKFWRSGEYTTDKPWLFVRGSAGTLPWAERVLHAPAQRALPSGAAMPVLELESEPADE